MEKLLWESGLFITPRHLELIEIMIKKNFDNRMSAIIKQTGLHIDSSAGGTEWQVIDVGSGQIQVKAGKAIFADYEFVEMASDSDSISVPVGGATHYVIVTRSDNENETGTIAVTAGSLTLTGTDTLFTEELETGDRILMDSQGAHANNEVELIIASVTDDTHLIVESLDADGDAVSFSTEAGNSFSCIGRFTSGRPASGNKNIRNHDQATLVVTTSPGSYSDGIQLATVVNNAGTLTITDLRDSNKLETMFSGDVTLNRYVWKKVEFTDTTSEQTLTTDAGELTLAKLDSGQSALPYFAEKVHVEIGTAYQDRQGHISTEPTINASGNVTSGITMSDVGSSGTLYFDIIVTQL